MRGWIIIAVVAAMMVISVGAAVLAFGVEPLQAGSGTYAVQAEELELVHVRGPDHFRGLYIAPYVDGEKVSMRFPLHNASRVSVRIEEVFPSERVTPCGWHPVEVEVSQPYRDQFEPLGDHTLGPDEYLDVRVVGEFACPERSEAVIEALALHETIPVDYRVAGIVPRTAEIDVGYRLGWTTADVDEFTDDLVTRIPPGGERRG